LDCFVGLRSSQRRIHILHAGCGYGLVHLDEGPERKIIPHELYSDAELKYPLLQAISPLFINIQLFCRAKTQLILAS